MKKNIKKLTAVFLLICTILCLIWPANAQAAIKLNATKKTLSIGQDVQLKVKGTTQKAKWSSSNKSVASVTGNGKVTAKKSGTATITAKVGNQSYKCSVTVKEKSGIIYKDEYVRIKFIGLAARRFFGGYEIKVQIENLSDRSLCVQVRETSINGYMADPIFSPIISPGKKINDEITIWGDDADNIPMNKVRDIETKFHIFDWNNWDFRYDTEIVSVM